jgi:hypothetical protein
VMSDTTLVSNSILCNIAHSASVAYGRDRCSSPPSAHSRHKALCDEGLFRCFNSRKMRPRRVRTNGDFAQKVSNDDSDDVAAIKNRMLVIRCAIVCQPVSRSTSARPLNQFRVPEMF